jgi:hypothetical protein
MDWIGFNQLDCLESIELKKNGRLKKSGSRHTKAGSQDRGQ